MAHNKHHNARVAANEPIADPEHSRVAPNSGLNPRHPEPGMQRVVLPQEPLPGADQNIPQRADRDGAGAVPAGVMPVAPQSAFAGGVGAGGGVPPHLAVEQLYAKGTRPRNYRVVSHDPAASTGAAQGEGTGGQSGRCASSGQEHGGIGSGVPLEGDGGIEPSQPQSKNVFADISAGQRRAEHRG
jgi:hypothetical protein